MDLASIQAQLDALIHRPLIWPVVVFFSFVTVAVVVERLGERLLRQRIGESGVWWGPVLLDQLLRPATFLVAIAGLWSALVASPIEPWLEQLFGRILRTIVVIVIARAAHDGLGDLLAHGARRADPDAWVKPQTAPLIDMVGKVVLVSLSLYLIFLAWSVDLTAWLASAGILGVGVGFAAQETLANLFAGVFIFADAPYRIGDFLILEDGTRGRVTDIGLRSTRLVTNDEAEIIVPNSQMAGGRIANVSTGRLPYERFGVAVQVSYGSDLEHVRAVLAGVAERLTHAVRDPAAPPRVRFASLDDSGITVRLLCFGRPEQREALVDEMIVSVHRALREAGVEIPFPQLDLHVRPEDP